MADSEQQAKKPRVGDNHGLPNKYLNDLEDDFFYHFGYSRKDCKDTFGDVKIVVCGGSMNRMKNFAELVAKEIGYPKTTEEELSIQRTDRFAFYKIGRVLSVSHGMGVPSLTIMIHEIIKLLRYAEADDPIIIRMGTSGGLGVPGGTLVVTNRAYNAFAEESHEIVVMGKRVSRPSVLNQDLARELLACQDDKSFQTVLAGTMCTDDFYEGQARLDGAICEHTEEEKLAYLRQLKEKGISNIEMECSALAAITHHTGVKAAVVCVALLDRLLGDQVTITPDQYAAFAKRPQELIIKFIKFKLGIQ